MEHTNVKEQPAIESKIVSAPQPWVTPVFERTPLNEALFNGNTTDDMDGLS